MQLTLKHFERHTDGQPGDHMVAQIQQMGDGATTSDTTDVIVDTSQDHKDIRISDGEQVLKITLDQNYEIQTVFQNDVVISDPGPQNQD